MLKTTPFHARTAALCLSHRWLQDNALGLEVTVE